MEKFTPEAENESEQFAPEKTKELEKLRGEKAERRWDRNMKALTLFGVAGILAAAQAYDAVGAKIKQHKEHALDHQIAVEAQQRATLQEIQPGEYRVLKAAGEMDTTFVFQSESRTYLVDKAELKKFEKGAEVPEELEAFVKDGKVTIVKPLMTFDSKATPRAINEDYNRSTMTSVEETAGPELTQK